MSEEFEEEEFEGDTDETVFLKAKQQLEERCKEANISIEEGRFLDENYLTVLMPNGRETRPRSFHTASSISKFLSIPFERYTYLSRYEAIASYDDGVIESVVTPLTPLPRQFLYRRLTGENDMSRGDLDLPPEIASLTSSNDQLRLSLGTLSDTASTLIGGYRPPRVLGLKISGFKFSRHDQAVQILEKLSNSLFFEIDLSTGVPLSLNCFPPHELIDRQQEAVCISITPPSPPSPPREDRSRKCQGGTRIRRAGFRTRAGPPPA